MKKTIKWNKESEKKSRQELLRKFTESPSARIEVFKYVNKSGINRIDFIKSLKRLDIEVYYNEMMREICNFYNIHDTSPQHTSTNNDEKRLGHCLVNMRTLKKSGCLHISNVKIANQMGLAFILDGYENRSTKNTTDLFNWIVKTGRAPTQTEKNSTAKRNGKWLNHLRDFKIKGKLRQSDFKIAESSGYVHLLDRESKTNSASNSFTYKLCNWINKNGHFPNPQSNIVLEKRLGQRLNYMRQSHKKGKLPQSNIDISIKEKIKNLFYATDIESKTNEKIREVCAFYLKVGEFPKENSTDKYESNLGVFLGNRRSDKKNGKLRQSSIMVAKEMGVSGIFNQRDREAEHNEITRIACKFYKNHGRYPRQGSSAQGEFKLARWLNDSRTRKRRCGVYRSSEKIAKEMGVPGLFDGVRRVKKKMNCP